MSGRGPTRLMSPRTTLPSCGSSSSDQRRSTVPTRVLPGIVVRRISGSPVVTLPYVIDGAADSTIGLHRAELHDRERAGPPRPNAAGCSSTGRPRRACTTASDRELHWRRQHEQRPAEAEIEQRARRAGCTNSSGPCGGLDSCHDRSEQRERFGLLDADLRAAIACASASTPSTERGVRTGATRRRRCRGARASSARRVRRARPTPTIRTVRPPPDGPVGRRADLERQAETARSGSGARREHARLTARGPG